MRIQPFYVQENYEIVLKQKIYVVKSLLAIKALLLKTIYNY